MIHVCSACYETYDTDGLARVLSSEGRARLIRLIEQLPHG